ncbi:class I SAM-dependent methyltransferase [uncultured Massilia sp.]|uniref:class I SAM-dependent methyltransferase n=1 Tax=uncultured Massilia sp. TaxID=169973 RepID=UPI0025839C50|nr:class I SAM-dependent methyltransferase [uncultured Massilia sp.]
MTHPLFDRDSARSYTERPPRQVPGFDSLHRMVGMLLAEHAPENAHMLVLGAGGGLEMKALADAYPGWCFDGIDPSAEMLKVARQTVVPHADRVQLLQGYIASAPDGPYDGATALLTFHFIPREQRLATLEHIFRRLRSGAAFTLAHISFPQTEPERSQWIARHVSYSAAQDADPAQLRQACDTIRARLTILAPEEEENMLRQAGFTGVALFYAGLSFRGWVAYKP